ncbi:ABC transporter ATP-binding protein YtrE [Luteitalea pratensis]|uniref:ABC transporter ATP-binding protein YtrE n=1 Tax=Luteitalea pratensis TaxID=1855912 RepID=A0A143PVX6_LUTPR|nr:ATP-binding cassette domain-containing protein [Luteitalea pratensis]AMY12531.1 ABC transporter ATP-binding protein YtrE [Luteitalea pratensis]
MSADVPVVQCTGVIKDYRGLRPLRLLDLRVPAGERVVLGGIDVIGAEVVTNLINGATLPDQGEVRVFGQATHEITDGDAWLAGLDQFGIVTARAVLLEGMTVRQNVALPLTIEIDPVPDTLLPQVDALAREAGIDDSWFDRMAHEAPVPVRMRIHLARALALAPRLVLLEHPTAALEAVDRRALADDVRRVADARALTLIACSQDREFARRVATRYLQLHPGTGALNPMSLG